MLKISANLRRHLGDTVPMPGPEQIHKKWYVSDDRKACCLVGWCSVAVGGTPIGPKSGDVNEQRAQWSAAIELAQLISEYPGQPSEWNDHVVTREKVAERWRETMQALGYKVENKPWTEVKR